MYEHLDPLCDQGVQKHIDKWNTWEENFGNWNDLIIYWKIFSATVGVPIIGGRLHPKRGLLKYYWGLCVGLVDSPLLKKLDK